MSRAHPGVFTVGRLMCSDTVGTLMSILSLDLLSAKGASSWQPGGIAPGL